MKPAAFAPSFAAAAAVLSILAAAGDVSANGGGYYTGGVKAAGDVVRFEPRLTRGVRILDEQLHIRLGPSSASVRVRYRMRNVSPGSLKVRFGFPVEEVEGQEDLSGWAPLPIDEGEDRSGKGLLGRLAGGSKGKAPSPAASSPPPPSALAYCRDYRASADGTPLASVFQPEDRGGRDTRFANLTGWLVSELAFGRDEEKEVEISFESLYSRKVAFVSESSTIDPVRFVYRLSTAACWAGPIAKGRIVLEAVGIDPGEVRVIKPVNRFRKEGELWVWDFEELTPTLDDDIEIEAQPAIRGAIDEYGGEHLTYFHKRGERWEMAHSNYRIAASSEQSLDDRDGPAESLKTWGSWISRGPGPGEWLELRPAVPKPLEAISFNFNGYFQEKDSFLAYARPKRIRVVLNGDHAFHMEVPDAPAPPGIAEIFRHVVRGYDAPVSKVRLEFEEVWPGKEHPHLSLKNLQLHVRLDEEPVLKPVR